MIVRGQRRDAESAISSRDRHYRRGAIMGLTMAEAFVLISFVLLLLLGAWQVQGASERERYSALLDMTLENLVRLQSIIDRPDTDIAAIERILEMGDIEKVEEIQANADRWRLIDKDELLRTYDILAELPEDVQRDIVDLVELEDPRNIIRIIEETHRKQGQSTSDERLAEIGARLDAAQAEQEQLVTDMRLAIGDAVEKVGGRIDADGSIVLPDTILFDAGKSAITQTMAGLLDEICEPWLQVLMTGRADVAGAQIEGHASTEWTGATADEAFRRNLSLSQRRAEVVLNGCIDRVKNKAILAWAYSHLVSVGYSSARPVLDSSGDEDAAASRRVVFSVAIDESGLLSRVEADVRRQIEP